MRMAAGPTSALVRGTTLWVGVKFNAAQGADIGIAARVRSTRALPRLVTTDPCGTEQHLSALRR